MKIAILTMFSGLSTTYSLVNVVAEHLKMLLDHDHAVKMIVTEHCTQDQRWGIYTDPRIEWVTISQSLDGKPIHLSDYDQPDQTLHPSFEEEATYFAKTFTEALNDVTHCMMHDILYQGWHYVHNIAIRKAQPNLPQVKFIAFTHSFPVNRPLTCPPELMGRYSPMENTLFAYPTYAGIPALAKQYHISEGQCRVVYNATPLLTHTSTAVQQLHAEIDLLSPEILIIYPGRFSTGKKFEKVAALAGRIKAISEKTIKIIFCDFPCQDTPSDDYKKAIQYVGTVFGLATSDMIFTSDHGYPDGFPHDSVLDLFSLSNVFICPSFSETFGLTVLEAASKGNFLVLNQKVPALEEIGKFLNAYFMDWDARNFGYNTKENYNPSEHAYYDAHAAEIVRSMREDRTNLAKTLSRTRFSAQWIWTNQLEPLLH